MDFIHDVTDIAFRPDSENNVDIVFEIDDAVWGRVEVYCPDQKAKTALIEQLRAACIRRSEGLYTTKVGSGFSIAVTAFGRGSIRSGSVIGSIQLNVEADQLNRAGKKTGTKTVRQIVFFGDALVEACDLLREAEKAKR
jgi:hypothetical protein